MTTLTPINKTTLPATLPTESLIAEYKSSQTPDLLLTKIRNHSYTDVLESNHARIGDLAERSQGWQAFTLTYILAALVRYLDFVGRRNTMNDEQAAQTAELILETYPWLKMDDIEYFFHLCKISHFGRLYDLNGAALLDWLRLYIAERNTELGRLYERQEREAREAEERRRRELEEKISPEEAERNRQEIERIAGRLAGKLKGSEK